MSEAVRVALIGCAHIHTPGFVKRLQARNEVVVAYVWDHEAARAAQWADALGAKQINDPTAALDDGKVSAVIICSETNRHEDLVLPAVAARKHLFVEKPLGIGADDAHRMAQAINAAGVLFQTGYFQRGHPAHLFIKEQIEKGTFGKITRLRHSNCHSGSLNDWFTPQWLWMTDMVQAGVGAFGDLGTHSLDIMLWLLGDVERATASIQVATGRYGDCDEYGEGLLEFANGVVGSIAAGWVDVAHPVNLVISGTEAHAYVANWQVYLKSEKIEGATGEKPWTELPEAWPHAFELFLDALAGKPNIPLVSAQEAAVRSAVMEALYAGAQRKQWIAPKKFK
jgi:predicted dehydrogenase